MAVAATKVALDDDIPACAVGVIVVDCGKIADGDSVKRARVDSADVISVGSATSEPAGLEDSAAGASSVILASGISCSEALILGPDAWEGVGYM